MAMIVSELDPGAPPQVISSVPPQRSSHPSTWRVGQVTSHEEFLANSCSGPDTNEIQRICFLQILPHGFPPRCSPHPVSRYRTASATNTHGLPAQRGRREASGIHQLGASTACAILSFEAFPSTVRCWSTKIYRVTGWKSGADSSDIRVNAQA